MGLLQSIRKLGLKSILSSALTLEEEIYSLYSSLKAEFAVIENPESLVRILDEELSHQSLIRDMTCTSTILKRSNRFQRIDTVRSVIAWQPFWRRRGRSTACLPPCTARARSPSRAGLSVS